MDGPKSERRREIERTSRVKLAGHLHQSGFELIWIAIRCSIVILLKIPSLNDRPLYSYFTEEYYVLK